jgi:hypothetical protein
MEWKHITLGVKVHKDAQMQQIKFPFKGSFPLYFKA